MRGQIFNIQKFCLHDGPGIRTTVFFKGCNLRCRWCANPESQNGDLQLSLDREKCTACGRCANICPTNAREVVNGMLVFDSKRCNHCGLCIGECRSKAIGREGSNVSSHEVLTELMKDQAFYAHSGGGVTFSGGEVLMQQVFATELARQLRSKGVHVAIETAAAVPTESFREFLREVDYVLIDFKHYDDARHLEGTGIGNAQVLENLAVLKQSGLDFLVRIPVIPGFNDSIEDARGFARTLACMGIREVQLLPFHQLGERKYQLLDMEYSFAGVKQLHAEDLKEYLKPFAECGVHARL